MEAFNKYCNTKRVALVNFGKMKSRDDLVYKSTEAYNPKEVEQAEIIKNLLEQMAYDNNKQEFE